MSDGPAQPPIFVLTPELVRIRRSQGEPSVGTEAEGAKGLDVLRSG